MKALRYILYILVILGAGSLLAYQGLVEKNLESSDIVKCGLIIAAAVLGMVKKPKNKILNKKAVYQKAYNEHILGAFEGDSKLEKAFYNAIHDYNNDQPAAAIHKLEKLRKECQKSADLRAVTVFIALCYDDMELLEDAVKQYEAALAMRPNSSIHSNLGLCLQRMGKMEEAMVHFDHAITLDPKNAFAYNNVSAMLFRQAEYNESLEYALQAVELDNNFPQALSTAALCYGMLEDRENYDTYYRRAVANGYDGRRITATLQRLQQSMSELDY